MRKVIEVIQFTDDLDGTSEATRTTTIGFEGKLYELDVSDEHYEEIRDFLAPRIAKGRRVTTKSKAVPRRDGGSNHTVIRNPERDQYLKDMRQWCQDNSIRNTGDTGWAYETNTGTGKHYYPPWLLPMYDAFLAGDPNWKELYGKRLAKVA